MMGNRLKIGKIKVYHGDRGFGFIQVDGESKDVFFHIKDMPDANILPQVGEKLHFQLNIQQGKVKAEHIVRLDVQSSTMRHTPISRAKLSTHRVRQQKAHRRNHSSNWQSLITLLVMSAGGYFSYEMYTQSNSTPQELLEQPVAQYHRCDDRKHCSQMNSYEEAVFFLQNCPNVLMDGDGDGQPCERQFR